MGFDCVFAVATGTDFRGHFVLLLRSSRLDGNFEQKEAKVTKAKRRGTANGTNEREWASEEE